MIIFTRIPVLPFTLDLANHDRYSTRKKKFNSDNGPTWRVPVRKLGEVSWERKTSYENQLIGHIECSHCFGVEKLSRFGRPITFGPLRLAFVVE